MDREAQTLVSLQRCGDSMRPSHATCFYNALFLLSERGAQVGIAAAGPKRRSEAFSKSRNVPGPVCVDQLGTKASTLDEPVDAEHYDGSNDGERQAHQNPGSANSPVESTVRP